MTDRSVLLLVGFLIWCGGCRQDVDSTSNVHGEPPLWQLSASPTVVIGETEGEEPYLLTSVRGATVLSNGAVAVLDGGTAELRVFSPGGEVLWVAGGKGEGPGEFDYVSWVRELTGGRILVYDGNRQSTTFFSTEGELLETQALDVARMGWPGIVFSALDDGSLVARQFPRCCDLGGDEFAVFGDSIQYTRIRDGRVDTLATMPNMQSFGVSDGGASTTGILPFGSSAAVGVGSTFVVAGSGLQPQAKILREDGAVESLSLPLQQRPLRDEDWKEMTDAFLTGRSGVELALRRLALEHIPRPTMLPVYDGLEVDGENRIWVRAYGLNENSEWTIVGLDGVPVAKIVLPNGARILEVGADYVLMRFTDDVGVERVGKWMIERGLE